MNKKVNLFIVGQPKSGTTALNKFLSQHPNIFMSPIKEPHFFCRDYHTESDAFHGRQKHYPYRSLEQYQTLFGSVSGQKIIGEASTGYLYSTQAAQEIHRYNPDAKIIIMLREPAEFLYSWHSEIYNNRGEDQADFKTALSLETSRKSGNNIPTDTKLPKNIFYSERTKYTKHISRYLELFPKENIKIILFDDFRSNNLGVLKQILGFLEVNESFTPKIGTVNPNEVPRASWTFKLMPLISKTWNFCVSVWPKLHNHKSSLSTWYKKVLFKEKKRPPMEESLKLKLKTDNLKNVQALSNLLNIDLITKWEYTNIEQS